jgi:hypothetical protein
MFKKLVTKVNPALSNSTSMSFNPASGKLKSIGEFPTKWYDPLMARHHRRNTQYNMDRATEFLTGKPGLNFWDERVREALGTARCQPD